MKSMTIAGFGVAVAAAHPAHAQGEATWLWSVTTQNGDAVVEPGETALVTLELLMESDVYEPDMYAFGVAEFDTLGGQGAELGQVVDWTVLNGLADITGDLTTTDGVSMFGTTAYQVDLQGPFVEDNPIAVFEFEWMPDVQGSYAVQYDTHSYLPEARQEVLIWIADESGNYTIEEHWPVTEAAISFEVVPAPAGATLLALGGTVALRRRR